MSPKKSQTNAKLSRAIDFDIHHGQSYGQSKEGDESQSIFEMKMASKFSSKISTESLSTVEVLSSDNESSESDDDPLLFTNSNVVHACNENEACFLLEGEGAFSNKEITPKENDEHYGLPHSPHVVDFSKGKKAFESQSYLDNRVMTPLQERINAITILPNMFYCFYFVLAGCWLSSEHFDISRQSMHDEQETFTRSDKDTEWSEVAQGVFGENHGTMENIGCINLDMFPHLHALPPLPVVAAATGIIVHAPFSFIYHWAYATTLHPSKRVNHWSRRLDHAFIHFASACMSYATSGRMDYFLLNAAYNLDCAYRQLEQKVRPRRNQIRIGISILLYTLPVLRRGLYFMYLKLCVLFGLSGWFFIAYPAGGWSHALFHVVISFCPHIIMVAACELQSSQIQISLAAKCAIMMGKA